MSRPHRPADPAAAVLLPWEQRAHGVEEYSTVAGERLAVRWRVVRRSLGGVKAA